MKYLVLFLSVALLSGCAGSAIDQDLRRKVDSNTTTLYGEYDPTTKATRATLTNTIHFRDPDAKAVRPLDP